MAIAHPIDWIKLRGINHGDTVQWGADVGFYCENNIYIGMWCIRRIGRNIYKPKIIHNYDLSNIIPCRAVLIEKTIEMDPLSFIIRQ
ncbi:MAG: hypothetical protein Q8O88_04120 [bacterium]|nr:hypothetical protein [bacterium]